MADEQPAGTGGSRAEESAPARSPIVFVSDASAEAERITDLLRASGYVVADVPLSMLSSRAAAQRPNVVILDVDGSGVLDELGRLRKLPGSGAIDFVYLGNGQGVVKNADDALANDGSAFFLRPVDIGGLIRRIEGLTGGPAARPDIRPSTPPPSMPAHRGLLSHPLRDAPPSSERPSLPSLPAPGARPPGPPLSMSTTSLADLVDAPRSFASFGAVSEELQQLLAEAERRAEVLSAPEVAIPSPEEEIEAVLPADVLASLDEPIDGDEDEEPGGTDGTGRPRSAHGGNDRDREGTGAHAKGTTAGGSRQPTTGAHGRSPSTGARTHERRLASDTPPPRAVTAGGNGTTSHGQLGRPRTTDSVSPSIGNTEASPHHDPGGERRHEFRRHDASADARHDSRVPVRAGEAGDPARADRARSRDDSPPPRQRGDDVARRSERSDDDAPPSRAPSSWHPPPGIGSVSPEAPLGSSVLPPAEPAAVVLGVVDARRFFADAIVRRATGALCFENDGVVRRVVMRDGDLVAAASGDEAESLVHFLAARGELPREEAPRLAARIPPYGRHAGAALVAHGWLRQDQLWVVLRAHAEWIASGILRMSRGSAQLEPEAPGRLRAEPSVFGASTGPEIFVELVRRSVTSEEALERLGGEASRIGDGPNQALLAECNLPTQDLELIHRGRGTTVAALLARAGDGEILPVMHALALLGVVEVVPAPDFGGREARGRGDAEVSALDEDALRARIRARLELVEEGDYFSLLGVPRDATGYEIRRAFVELRRTFEPARILTPRLLDLSDDVRKIVLVLEEAYEILRDGARRERYRRAIDARPE